MSCIAVWCNPREQAPKNIAPIEAHFNLWKLRNTKLKKTDQFLDIGLMVQDPGTLKSLKVYVPFTFNEKVIDLGQKLTTTQSIQLIFNEPWCTMIYPGISTIDVLDYNKNFIFQIYRLTEKDVNNVEPAFRGSILTIPMPIDVKRRKTYFRFRIFVSDTSPITKEDRPSNSWLESALLVTETIDFHVNEERNLSEDLLRTIHAEDKITFSKIHLYLMRYDYFDHVFSHPLPIDTRTLEENVWTDYLGAEYNCNRILAYHWRYKEDLSTKVGDKNNANSNTLPSIGFDKFNVFAKFRFQNANKVTILIFLAVLLAIGIAGSLIANIIWSLITH